MDAGILQWTPSYSIDVEVVCSMSKLKKYHIILSTLNMKLVEMICHSVVQNTEEMYTRDEGSRILVLTKGEVNVQSTNRKRDREYEATSWCCK